MEEITDDAESSEYSALATAESKSAIFLWCVSGGIYAAKTWHLLWLPGLLLFIPGIFIASIISAAFFIPVWHLRKSVKRRFEQTREKNWSLLVAATVIRIFGVLSPIAGSIFYIRVLRRFLE